MTNTVDNQQTAVSLQLTDELLGFQGAQSPPTRKVLVSQLGAYYLSTSGGTLDGGLTISSGGLNVTGQTSMANNLIMQGSSSITCQAGHGVSFDGGVGNFFIATEGSLLSVVAAPNQIDVGATTFRGGIGYATRSGGGGTYGANNFNISWNGSAAGLWIDNTLVGTINVTSDRRIKKKIKKLPNDAISRVLQLRPVEYEHKTVGLWKADEKRRDGFIADELQAVIPSAVEGDAGAVNPDGSIAPQSLNLAPVLANVVAALQEMHKENRALLRRVEQLEKRVAG